MTDDTLIIKILFLVIGVIIIGGNIIAGVYYLIKNKKEKKYTCKTYGKVISNIRREEHIGHVSDDTYSRYVRWYSLCEYKVGDTKCVRETNIGTSQPREIGKVVTIYYNPNNCHESYIDGDNKSVIKAIVALVSAIISSIFLFLIINSI